MSYTRTSQKNTLSVSMVLRVLGAVCGVLLMVYIYFAFSTTSLIAQHRSFDKQLDQMIAQRSDLEYEYHTTSEQLFAASASQYQLSTPLALSYISLSEGVNVAFAVDTQ